jgi:hypothetical protein
MDTTIDEPISQPHGQVAHGVRRRLAVVLGLQPLLLTINALFHPEVDIEGASFLEAVSAGSTRWYVVHLVAALGAVLWVPAAFGVGQLITGGYRRSTTAAMSAVMAGSALLALGFVTEGSFFRLLAHAAIDETAALTLAEGFLETPEFFSIMPGFGLAAIGTATLAVVLLRQGAAMRWHALTYALGIVVSAISPPGSPIGPLALAVATVAAIGMARHLRAV